MLKLKKYLVATFLSGAMFCASIAQSQAMQVPTYDHMSDKDQADYLICLVGGSMDYLKAHGLPDQAQKVRDFFIQAGAAAGPGVDAFLNNLDIVRLANKKNANDPTKKPFEVEHAFALTLKHDGIIVPLDNLFAAGQAFQPSSPPGSSNSGTPNSPLAPTH